MREYHKIDTVFERDTNGTKKLIYGKFRDETVEFLKDNEWRFTEKIDGTNIRVHWDGHEVTFAGRTDKATIPSSLFEYLTETFQSNEAEEMFEQLFGDKEVTLYGEGYGKGIQGNLGYRDDVSFILFDVLIGDIWLEYDNVSDIAKSMGIDVVPVVLTGTIQNGITYVKTRKNSTIGCAKLEGVVGKPMTEVKDRLGRRIVVKIKAKDFM